MSDKHNFEDNAQDMALSVLYHIETMYPKVWAEMSGSCRRSLKNTIKSTFQIHAADIAAHAALHPSDNEVK